MGHSSCAIGTGILYAEVHSAECLGDKIYIIGGRTHPADILDDVYQLDPVDWSFVRLKTDLPPRHRHTAVQYADKEAVLFGGADDSGPSNELWIMSPEGRSVYKPTHGNAPSPRMSHGACVVNNSLYVYGGFSDYGEVFDDLYQLDLDSFVWSKIEFPDLSLPKCFSHCLFKIKDDMLGVIGGCDRDDPEDLYVIDLASKKSRILKIETRSDWVPLRQTPIVHDRQLMLIGGGAFCFSFGTLFSSSLVLDLNPVIQIIETEVYRRADIVGLESGSDLLDALVVPSRSAKKVKDILKGIGLLDLGHKSTVLESGNRIAFPLQKEAVLDEDNTSVRQFLLRQNGDLADDLPDPLVVQKVDFVSAAACRNSPVQELKIFFSSLLRSLREDSSLISSLIDEIPDRWERLGDIVLFPEPSFSSAKWQQILSERTWGEVSNILKCRGIAKQARISQAGRRHVHCIRPLLSSETRDSRVVMLHGGDGWVLHRENGVSFQLDVTKCMFSSGNVTERIRMSKLSCANETIVDLYSGIGYYSLPVLVHTKVSKVPFLTEEIKFYSCTWQIYACEWNKHAVKALEMNLASNKVEDRCTVLFGDCRKVAPKGTADRVILGLLPSSKGRLGDSSGRTQVHRYVFSSS